MTRSGVQAEKYPAPVRSGFQDDADCLYRHRHNLEVVET